VLMPAAQVTEATLDPRAPPLTRSFAFHGCLGPSAQQVSGAVPASITPDRPHIMMWRRCRWLLSQPLRYLYSPEFTSIKKRRPGSGP